MSAGYADRLTKGYNYGRCGDPEHVDNERRQSVAMGPLVKLVRDSRYIVVHSGAGISTSCGIPDFRGPRGIWTLEKKGLPRVDEDKDKEWASVKPSLTHMALYALYLAGKLKFIVTQNVDGLHLRSGIPRDRVAELHGNVFKETCPKCGAEYFQPFDVEGMGFKETGNKCTFGTCDGNLKDELLDWEDELPEPDLEISREHCKRADLSICLGTSLRVQPANELPMETKKHGGKLVIVNLQTTQIDSHADVRIHGYVDAIMKELMERLGIPIPLYDSGKDFVVQRTTLDFATRSFALPPTKSNGGNRGRDSGKSRGKKRKERARDSEDEKGQESKSTNNASKEADSESLSGPPTKKARVKKDS